MTGFHFLSKNVFWENAVEYLRYHENLSFQTFAIVFSTQEKCTGRDFWSSRNERKPLSQQKCVLRKCCGESQKWWVLELSNLCHCVQHPWKLTGRDFWSSGNKRKPLSKLKCVLRKCCRDISETMRTRSFQTCVIVFSTPENLLVGISGALGMKKSHFLSKIVFSEIVVGYLRNGAC